MAPTILTLSEIVTTALKENAKPKLPDAKVQEILAKKIHGLHPWLRTEEESGGIPKRYEGEGGLNGLRWQWESKWVLRREWESISLYLLNCLIYFGDLQT